MLIFELILKIPFKNLKLSKKIDNLMGDILNEKIILENNFVK